jgi:CheY-like chemotaxis protein
MRMVICDYLRECGYKAIESTGSKEAIVVLEAGTKVHAALCAVQLPGDLDGFGLAQWIRANRPEVDVLLTTGAKMAAKKAGDLCEDGPLDQPYHPDQVVKRLKILFEKRRRAQR